MRHWAITCAVTMVFVLCFWRTSPIIIWSECFWGIKTVVTCNLVVTWVMRGGGSGGGLHITAQHHTGLLSLSNLIWQPGQHSLFPSQKHKWKCWEIPTVLRPIASEFLAGKLNFPFCLVSLSGSRGGDGWVSLYRPGRLFLLHRWQHWVCS